MAIVRVEQNNIPTRSYMFYLTHGDRAKKKSFKDNISLETNNIYQQSREWRKQHRSKPRISSVDKLELVFSLSVQKNEKIKNRYFEGNIEEWEQNHLEGVNKILKETLGKEKLEYLVYSHKRDKNNERVHCHVLVWPYEKKIEKITGMEMYIKMELLNREILKKMKVLYKEYEETFKIGADEKKRVVLEKYEIIDLKPVQKQEFLVDSDEYLNDPYTFRGESEKEAFYNTIDYLLNTKSIKWREILPTGFLSVLAYIRETGDREILNKIEGSPNFIRNIGVTKKLSKIILLELSNLVSSQYAKDILVEKLNSSEALREERMMVGVREKATTRTKEMIEAQIKNKTVSQSPRQRLR
jgi:hypothetical protein